MGFDQSISAIYNPPITCKGFVKTYFFSTNSPHFFQVANFYLFINVVFHHPLTPVVHKKIHQREVLAVISFKLLCRNLIYSYAVHCLMFFEIDFQFSLSDIYL